jgi:GAF domain-containing protein
MSADLDAEEFARIAESLRSAPTPKRTAEEIVDYVRVQLNASLAGITLIRSQRKLETCAATDRTVEQADALQYDLDEGPCRDSSWKRQTLVVTDLASDGRWPRWTVKVAELGIASVLAAELTDDQDHRLGSINVYWTEPRTFTSDEIAFVNIFARHAALALAESFNVAGLNTALDTRKRIGQAQGILMERYGLDETRAFEVLRRYSQDHNIKLRDVADDLIDSGKLATTQRVSGDLSGTPQLS